MSYHEYVTKDSGERQEFPTGSVRDRRQGKGRFDLLPPLAIRRIAGVYERGAAKYGDRNWEKGQPMSRYMDSALRHIFQYIEGLRDEDHLAQSAWNLLSAIHTDECLKRGQYPPELDDLPNYCVKSELEGITLDEIADIVAEQVEIWDSFLGNCKPC